jgi:DNA-directed RNA polymerase specialized sigma24 family protein
MQSVAHVMPPTLDLSAILTDPAFRAALFRYVGARAPASEVDDIVQATFAAALAAPDLPEQPEQVRRWVYGIARHKIVDFYRRVGREGLTSSPPEASAESAPYSARDLLRWAERELPPGEQAESTLEWMVREAVGDKLESIASEEQIPAPRVRQRVSRLRRHFRERWALHAALLAVLLLGAAGAALYQLRRAPVDIARETPAPPVGPERRAAELRRSALRHCAAERYDRCLQELDEAKRLDPAGDTQPSVKRARQRALDRLAPVPSVPSTPPVQSAAPVPSAAPTVMQKAPAKPKEAPSKVLRKSPRYLKSDRAWPDSDKAVK